MHPVRHLNVVIPAPAWTLVWAVGIALWIGGLAYAGIQQLELLSLDAPELPERSWPAVQIEPRTAGPAAFRDPFTPPVGSDGPSIPVCGVR